MQSAFFSKNSITFKNVFYKMYHKVRIFCFIIKNENYYLFMTIFLVFLGLRALSCINAQRSPDSVNSHRGPKPYKTNFSGLRGSETLRMGRKIHIESLSLLQYFPLPSNQKVICIQRHAIEVESLLFILFLSGHMLNF